jgi:cation diffusion facilitator family transporter
MLANLFIKIFLPRDFSPTNPEHRAQSGIKNGYFSIGTNVILFIIKLWFGLVSNSISLLADAFHTLSDIASSVVVIFGFKVSQKPPDKEHPFGHGRAETIATLTIAMFIGFVGFEFIKASVERLIDQTAISISTPLFIVIFITIIVKEIMARICFGVGTIIDSDTLKGDALHHRSDMLSSVLVLVGLIASIIGYPLLDAIMGCIIAVMMLVFAYNISKNAVDDLLGKPASEETIQEIFTLANEIEGVYNIHDIVVHSYGVHKYISLHVEVSENQTAEQMHQIADAVEHHLAKQLHADVVTHTDPVTIDGKDVLFIRNLINSTLEKFQIKYTVQDLRIVGKDKIESILFEIPIEFENDNLDSIKNALIDNLHATYSDSAVNIKFKTQRT